MAAHRRACSFHLPPGRLVRLRRSPEAPRTLPVWSDPETERLTAAVAGAGTRPPPQPKASLMLKALLGLLSRQTVGLAASLPTLAKLTWPLPDFSTSCWRSRDLTVTIPHRSERSALACLRVSALFMLGLGVGWEG